MVESTYRLDAEGKVDVPTKIGVHPDRANSFLHAMPAWVGGERALGMKWVSYFPGNIDRRLPDSTGVIILNDPEHGLPCCIMEGMYVTFIRTAACAAVAARHLSPRPPRTLGLIGCGGLGLWSLRTLTEVFPSIEQVFVSSRTPRSRNDFCAKMAAETNRAVIPVEDPLQAVRGMDIVITSMPPGDVKPVTGDALAPGSVFIPLDIVNSWQDDVLTSADRVAADDPGNFAAQVQAKRASAFQARKEAVRTQDIVAAQSMRTAGSDRSFVAVCGIASTDVVVGWEIYRRASAANIGFEFDLQG